MSDYNDRKYEIVSYDENWANQFQSESEKIHAVFGEDARAIEHIGSTAVPGLAGKPVIDILVLVRDAAVAEKYKVRMEELGYQYLGDYVKKGGRLFVKDNNGARSYNVHIFPTDHPHVQEMLSARDYLRSHSDEVKKYGDYKKELFMRYANDYGQYRKLKDAYMDDLLKRVLKK